jgi:hypothetical protein
MNKYLLMSAAALLAGTGAANAGTYSFTFSGFCDGGTINTNLPAAAWIHTNVNCASGTSQGAGLFGAGHFGKAKTLSKLYVLSDNYLAKDQGNYSESVEYLFNKRLTKWELWICSASTCTEEAHGRLTSVAPGAHRTTGSGTTSTVAKVAGLLNAHRQ